MKYSVATSRGLHARFRFQFRGSNAGIRETPGIRHGRGLSSRPCSAYGGRWSWACELLVNFRTHYALLLSLALVIAAALRHWRIAGVAAIGLALNVWPMYGAFFGPGTPPVSNARAVRVAAFNVNIANDNLPGIAAYLESLAVDVAVLEELSPANADQLAALLPRLPHRYLAEHEGVWGVVILSRWPLIAPQPATQDGRRFAGACRRRPR